MPIHSRTARNNQFRAAESFPGSARVSRVGDSERFRESRTFERTIKWKYGFGGPPKPARPSGVRSPESNFDAREQWNGFSYCAALGELPPIHFS